MADDVERPHPHLYLPGTGTAHGYTAHQGGGGGGAPLPDRNREAHAVALKQALQTAIAAGEAAIAQRDATIASGVPGFYIDFLLPVDQAGIVDKLEKRGGKFPIELVTVTPVGADQVSATVFVPQKQKDYYSRKVEDFRTKNVTRKRTLDDGTVVEEEGGPRNAALVAAIDTARLAIARSFYTDMAELFPAPDEATWWEVWLRKGTRAGFSQAANVLNLLQREQTLEFAERDIVVVQATAGQLGQIIANSDAIAELRLARDTPAFFLGMDGAEQRLWSDELAERLAPCPADAPAVCILDSGGTIGHQLIAPFLAPDDQQAFHPDWSVEDSSNLAHGGHGTRMAGTALYGDLAEALAGDGPIEIGHRLESVKILPDVGANEPDLYGAITASAIARAEIAAPQRPRSICLALTTPGDHYTGRPSSWSAEIDALAFGRDGQPRLIAVSAGNMRDALVGADYPHRNDTMPIESPAQAWNCLTVGAYTDRTLITDPDFDGWSALAPAGDISPRSRTSNLWRHEWPLKPDVVFEGGNAGVNPANGDCDHIDDLALLTTFRRPAERPFTTTGDTSAATALGARMGAQILAHKPTLWPETVRGLIVHSAEWTPAMLAHVPTITKRGLIRRVGFGVPSLVRAIGSLDNDVTLVVEDQLRPFKMVGTEAKTDELKVHALPWPRERLLGLPAETTVQLRLTLSYFIEPNPGERGQSRRHSYASHGLRYDLKPADEQTDVFLARITSEAGPRPPKRVAPDKGWLIGPMLRNRGSLHADLWEGTATDLAARDSIIIHPTGGWWRDNPAKRHAGEAVRYCLIASIRVAADVDLYSEISAQIMPEVAIPV